MSEPTDDQEQSTRGLRDAAVTGIRWMLLGRVGADGISFAAAIALARLVSPAEFGHAAIALILLPLSAILTFEGFGSALVQRKTVDRKHLETAALASIVAGFLLSALVFVGAPVVGPLLFGQRTAQLIQLASPLFFIAGLTAVARSVLWRRLEFRTVTLVETGSLAIGSIASVLFALLGLDATAIVLGALCSAVASTILLLVRVPPVTPRWHRRELREIVGFGGPASGAGFLYVAITNIDYTIIAIRLSAAQTGFYWRAFQLGVVYQDKISGIMMRLAFPIYSRTKDLQDLRRLHERATRVHAAVIVPLLAVLIVVAPALVPWLFGPAWQPAVLPSQILAVAGMIAAVLTGFPQVLLAAGRPRALLRFNMALLAVYGAVVWVTAAHGIVAVAVGVVVVHVAMLVVVYAVLFKRVVGMPVGRMVSDLAPAVAGASALLAVAFPLSALLGDVSAPPPLRVALVAAVGLLVHCIVVRTFFPSVWRDLSALAIRIAPARLRTRRRQPAVPPATA